VGPGRRAGAGAVVSAVAVQAARGLLGPSLGRVRADPIRRLRWLVYVIAGGVSAALIGPYLVVVLLAVGAIELLIRRRPAASASFGPGVLASAGHALARGGLGAVAWTAFKIGALAFGGGFVIIPLMQNDAVHAYHWMSNAQFLNAVALGQVTPGPVVATVAAVGYAAHGIAGGVLAAVVAFVPSFSFVLLGGGRFERLRESGSARAFLDGAGPAAIGAILGAAFTLADALHEGWQFGVLGAAAVALLLLRRGVVATLIGGGVIGVVVALAGGPLQ
jgi:chromate transporter